MTSPHPAAIRRGSSRTVYLSPGPPHVRVEITDVEVEGRTQEWHTVTTQEGQAGAVILASSGDRILVGRHWRLSTGSVEVEFPRGFGEKGEDSTETARRELAEETGLTPAGLHVLGTVYADTGLLTNPIDVVVADIDEAEGTPRGPSGPEVREFETLTWLTPAEFRSLVASGTIRDGITLAAFAMWQARPVGQFREDPRGLGRDGGRA